MQEAAAPGWDGRTLRWPVRVYYHHTDAGGVVYHGTYLDFMEAARIESWRRSGSIWRNSPQEKASCSSSTSSRWTTRSRRGSTSASR